ncbi:uncharacterized protein LOC131943523 [Physella acuta]|uniref:uncharacterized protein LOC131943523 n=1 Tax=Physella acuta TaxID=109671 RepID=UPI0027DE4F14|nr:uncharacterized protein LOC131943523 [Physella acuta]
MEAILGVLAFIVATSLAQVGPNAASGYTNRLLPALNRRGRPNGSDSRSGGQGINPASDQGPGFKPASDQGFITSFSGPGSNPTRPVGDASNVGGVGHMTPVNRCTQLDAGCVTTQVDPAPICKYTYDYTQIKCVKVEVTSECVAIHGGVSNLFDTLLECEQHCN